MALERLILEYIWRQKSPYSFSCCAPIQVHTSQARIRFELDALYLPGKVQHFVCTIIHKESNLGLLQQSSVFTLYLQSYKEKNPNLCQQILPRQRWGE